MLQALSGYFMSAHKIYMGLRPGIMVLSSPCVKEQGDIMSIHQGVL